MSFDCGENFPSPLYNKHDCLSIHNPLPIRQTSNLTKPIHSIDPTGIITPTTQDFSPSP